MAGKGKLRKIRVGVVFGGRSGEHEVSLNSARSVMDALDRQKYDVIPIGITKSGRWLTGDVVKALLGKVEAEPATLLPDPTSPTLMKVEHTKTSPVVLSQVTDIDVIFPVLHGPYGEDGTIQGLLELANIPYVGAGVVGSAVSMDKAMFKYVMAAHKIDVLPWELVTVQTWAEQPETILNHLESRFIYPIFTKPANLGSSVGVSKCNNRTELQAGLNEASKYDRRLIVEQGISPRELEVSVLGNEDPIASVVGEIRPRRAFYDYVAKYVATPGSDEESELLIPAPLGPEVADTIRELAIKAYKAVDCAGMARVDMLLDKQTGQIYLNEINTIPGFTNISMYAKLWAATGIDYTSLLDQLIELALKRHQIKSNLKTSFAVGEED